MSWFKFSYEHMTKTMTNTSKESRSLCIMSQKGSTKWENLDTRNSQLALKQKGSTRMKWFIDRSQHSKPMVRIMLVQLEGSRLHKVLYMYVCYRVFSIPYGNNQIHEGDVRGY